MELAKTNFIEAAKIIRHLETYLGLVEVDHGRVYSFTMSKASLAKKKAMWNALRENNTKVSRYMQADDRSEITLAVAKSMYASNLVMAEICKDHIKRIGDYLENDYATQLGY